jgi:integrase
VVYYRRALNKLSGKLGDITPHHIVRITAPLRPGSRFGHLAAYKVFFNWCVQKHYLDRSPVERMRVKKLPARTRVLSDYEIKCIWQVCELGRSFTASLERGEPFNSLRTQECPSQLINPTFARIVQLLILTGQRKNEIASIHTSWIQNGTLVVPKEIAKNAREHAIPISPLAASLLHYSRSGLLFPAARDPSRPFSFWQAKDDLDRILGDKVGKWTLHDLRRTMATRMAEMGTAPHVIERILNHVTGSLSVVHLAYNRATYQREMREAIELWERHIRSLCAVLAD